MTSLRVFPVFPLLLLLVSSCGLFKTLENTFNREPEVEEVAKSFNIAIPLAWSITAAMTAANGFGSDGVEEVVPLAGSAGTGVCRVSVDTEHPLPAGSATPMDIYVTGLWSSADEAVMSVFFTRETGGSLVLLGSATAVPVERDSGGYRIAWASPKVGTATDTAMSLSFDDGEFEAQFALFDRVSTDTGTIGIDQDAWMVFADTNGTPGLDDDRYSVYGAGQAAGASPSVTSIIQMVILDGRVSGCSRNPVSGHAILREIDISSGEAASNFPVLGTVIFTFHDRCDGDVEVTLATGNYIGRTGSEMNLGL